MVGVLVLITGQIMFEFTPAEDGGPGLLSAVFGMDPGHYVGYMLAVVSGVIGLALYLYDRRVNKVTVAVSILSILLGVVFLAIINIMIIMGMMAIIAQITLLVGIIGIAGSVIVKTRRKED
ncbi:MAG TPA: hypothetical protein VLV31_01175 [Candidatus Acidoferrales bacterium]|nr:hypothetical protein [Candidatus Acidoferrales bacterium]